VHGDQLHPALAQPFRQPRAVVVADDPGEDLGSGHDDAGPDAMFAKRTRKVELARPAHDEQSGRCESGSRRGRRPGRSS
jgi:hypothetical protein